MKKPDPFFDPGTRVDVWVAHQAAMRALGQALEAFAEEGVVAVAVKGVVLAHRLYDDVASRPIQDVDLRVRPADLPRVEAVARRRGWELDRSSRQVGCLGFRVGVVLVEVETTIGPAGLCPMRVEDLLARALPRTLPAGVRCLEPDVVDHAILLVVNAFKDKIVHCPSWSVSDLVRIAEAPGFDEAAFVERVRRLRMQTMTWILAGWLVRHHGSEAWARIQGALAHRRVYARAFDALAERSPGSLAMRLLARAGSDAPTMRAYALWSALAGTVRALATGGRFRSPIADGRAQR